MEFTAKELQDMGITSLKSIAKELKIRGYTKYKQDTKAELEAKIIEKMKETPPPDSPLTLGTPDPPVVPLPKPPLPPPALPKAKKVVYSFTPDDVLESLEVGLRDAESSGPPPPTGFPPITPDLLLKELKKNSFVDGILESLAGLYAAKKDKYGKILERTIASIRKDELAKERLRGKVSTQELDNMFPVLPTNIALKEKVQTLKEKAGELLEGLSRKRVREGFLRAIRDIQSITGDSRAHLRDSLSRQLYILSQGWKPFMDSFINMIFTGPAGVGKTRLAGTVARVYKNTGVLLDGENIVVSPKDLVGQYVGQTGPKTAGVLMKGLESVVFIDEAYQIMNCVNGELQTDAKTFGPEAITELVNFLDKYVGLSVVIVAGYAREMKNCFLGANEGLARRFPIRWDLPTYAVTDLLNIFINEVNRRLGGDNFTEDIARYIYTLMYKLDQHDPEIWENQAGDVMNLVTLFLNNYYGSYGVKWGDIRDDHLIINATFNQYLQNKGYIMTVS